MLHWHQLALVGHRHLWSSGTLNVSYADEPGRPAGFRPESHGKGDRLAREHFLDLVGAANLIFGPNSAEMTMHSCFQRGGRELLQGGRALGYAFYMLGWPIETS